MKEEIKVGVEFLRQFLAKYGNNLHQAQIDLFALKLQITLEERYVNHWYDALPMKGQAFRCLRVKRSENYIDPVLERLLFDLKLNLNQLGLPNDFTLWIDPGEVSVRFGDQVGYTYTIARLNTNIQTASSSSFSPSTLSANSEQTTAKPCLVVQNAEKILFDEKLTDFIRQNSCNNTNDEYLTAGAPFNNEFTEDESKLSDLVIDELIKLSAEKRTISPPHAAISSPSSSSLTQNNSAQFLSPKSKEVKRQNSSNIAIVNKNSKDYDPTKTAITNQNSNAGNFDPNRLSFNDSCYYSSSSSSCASSFESNDETNLMMHQLGWFQNNNNNNNRTADHTSKKSSCNFNSFYNYDQSQQSESLPFSQGSSSLFSDQHSSYVQQSSFGFSAFGNDITNNSINSQTLYSNFEQYNNNINNNKLNYLTMGSANIYSDASSERSDTPNSCITSNSSFLMIPSSISILKETTYDSPVVFMDSNSVKTDLNNTKSLLNVVGSPVNSSSSSSTASDVSTKTTIASKNLYTNPIDDDDLKLKQEEQIENIKMDMIVEASIDEASKICKSNSSSPAPLSPNSEKKTDQAKKEDSYCGYVESFPYYYKLNRLYNALAVQKMQTERLRKTGIFNNNSNSSSLSTTPNPASTGTTPNQSNANLMRNLNSNSPKPLTGTSPSQFVMNRIGNSSLMSASSPSSSPSVNNSILNSTSPTAVNINKNFHSRINNNIGKLKSYLYLVEKSKKTNKLIINSFCF